MFTKIIFGFKQEKWISKKNFVKKFNFKKNYNNYEFDFKVGVLMTTYVFHS